MMWTNYIRTAWTVVLDRFNPVLNGIQSNNGDLRWTDMSRAKGGRSQGG